MPTHRNTAAWLLVLVLLSGCESGPHVVAVKGTVTRGGQPLKNLLVTFYPEDDGRPSSARTDDQGKFELIYDRNTKGATLGKHKVVAAFRPRNAKEEMDFAAGNLIFHPEQDAILEKYGKRDTTALTVEINHAESDLQLKLD